MIQDYERTKGDLTFHIQKNEEVCRELEMTKAEKRALEDSMRLVENEITQHRATSRDLQAADSREIVKTQQLVLEKERDIAGLKNDIAAKHNEVMEASKETNNWKDFCDRQKAESDE